jgi:hypothetical protein
MFFVTEEFLIIEGQNITQIINVKVKVINKAFALGSLLFPSFLSLR